MAWKIVTTKEYAEWFEELFERDLPSAKQVAAAVNVLRREGPLLGRPLVDRIQGASLHNLKELRPGSTGASELRVLFAFDPWRSAVLLIAGDKAGHWSRWYDENIPRAERLFADHLIQTSEREESKG
jgi:hypothetical protein